MLQWTMTFLVIALLAAVFAFTGIATGSGAFIAEIIFYIFLVFFVISVITGAFRRDYRN